MIAKQPIRINVQNAQETFTLETMKLAEPVQRDNSVTLIMNAKLAILIAKLAQLMEQTLSHIHASAS